MPLHIIIAGVGAAWAALLAFGLTLLKMSARSEERATEERAAIKRGLYAVPDEEEK